MTAIGVGIGAPLGMFAAPISPNTQETIDLPR